MAPNIQVALDVQPLFRIKTYTKVIRITFSVLSNFDGQGPRYLRNLSASLLTVALYTK